MNNPITALVAGGDSRSGGGVVRFDFVENHIKAQRTLADGTQAFGSSPLTDVERDALLQLAAGVTAELQASVRAEENPNMGQFVEVHRGDDVVRVENLRGQLIVEPLQSIISRAIFTMARVAPPPAPTVGDAAPAPPAAD